MSISHETVGIEVDDRESGSPVLPALRQCADFRVTVMRLPLGDYRVDGRFLFERKTLTDLVAAIKDGRLFRQALKLSATTLRPAIILEGTGRELAGSGMRWEAIQRRIGDGGPLLRRTAVAHTHTGGDRAHHAFRGAAGAHVRLGSAAAPRPATTRKARPPALYSAGVSRDRA